MVGGDSYRVLKALYLEVKEREVEWNGRRKEGREGGRKGGREIGRKGEREGGWKG